MREITLGQQNMYSQVMQIIDLISLHAEMHNFERFTLALAVVSFTLMSKYQVINIEPEEDVRSLQKYIVKLTNNAEEKSFHSKFYQIFEAFISLSCKEILPEGFSLK